MNASSSSSSSSVLSEDVLGLGDILVPLVPANDTVGYASLPDANMSEQTPTPTLSNSTVASTLGPPLYYSLPYRTVGCLFVSTIFVVGFVGNVMVVLVVWRTRSLHTPTNCYLLSLSLADILLLVSAPLPTIVDFFLIIDQTFLGQAGCCIMVFSQYLGVNVSSLSITFFTIERYIAICHPMKAQTMCTVKRAKRIIAGLWLFGICYCGPWLGLITTNTKTYSDGTTIEMCAFKLKRSNYYIYYMADLVIFYVIPLLLTCILYGLIARILYSSSRPVAHTGHSKTMQNGSSHTTRATGGSSTSSSRVQVGPHVLNGSSHILQVTGGSSCSSSRVQ